MESYDSGHLYRSTSTVSTASIWTERTLARMGLSTGDTRSTYKTTWLAYNLSDDALNPTVLNSTSTTISPACIYQTYQGQVDSLSQYLGTMFSGEVGFGPNALSGPAILQAIFQEGNVTYSTIDEVFNRVAQALTVWTREQGSNVTGQVYKSDTCVNARWGWLAYPVSLVIGTMVFLVWTIEHTRRSKGNRQGYKSLPLALFFHRLGGVGSEGPSSNIKLRQSWNKYNLYNIQKIFPPRLGAGDPRTFFQQKWQAKSLLRNYHGEHVVERKWVRMFSRRLLGVVDMNVKYMAKYDGSEMAAGRGSGLDKRPQWDKAKIFKRAPTPYMQMTFAPMERRLDIAVFRAMFASSARQARQFCVHGAVKVNGKVMPYPSYRLNPGDMFQVDPDRVLFATGAPKFDENKEKGSKKRAQAAKAKAKAEAEEERKAAEAVAAEQAEAEAAESKEEEAAAAAAAPAQDPDTTDAPEPEKLDMKPTREYIRGLADKAKKIIQEDSPGANQKHKLRKFIAEMRHLAARSGHAKATPGEIAEELSNQLADISLVASGSLQPQPQEETPQVDNSNDIFNELSSDELRTLEKRMAEHIRDNAENPWDPSKPYRTPWRPRPYMSPFAFIPKYLEVNHNICAAVYLRHPVARPGNAEVPTPFAEPVNQLAFNWYLRRS
ncbi:hypothetical protein F4804DRAFT_329313 [Jackrogersella minutella]|nr:hypothetical protein F4804DRAFT_329313 [Jackrogersella minutella]